MRNWLLALLAVPMVAAAPASLLYKVDAAQSDVTAKVGFFGISSKTARFPSMSGSVRITPDRPSDIAIDVSLDAQKITAPDKVTLSRLRGESFFWVERYPTVRFAGQNMQANGPKSGTIAGQLTARGVTRPVKLAVTFDRPIGELTDGKPISISGTATINRRDFGMTAYSAIVSKKVDITLKTRMVPAV